MKFKVYLREHKIRYQIAAESLGITEQSVNNRVAGTQRRGLLLAIRSLRKVSYNLHVCESYFLTGGNYVVNRNT